MNGTEWRLKPNKTHQTTRIENTVRVVLYLQGTIQAMFDKKHDKKVINIQALSDMVTVDWVLGTTCTYSCSYCPSVLHTGTHAWLSYDHFCRVVDHLRNHYQRPIQFLLSGGETTVDKTIGQKLEYLKQNDDRVVITSNGSRTANWWDRILDNVDEVILSCHPEFVDIDRFVQLARHCNTVTNVSINMAMLPEIWDKCFEYACILAKKSNGYSIVTKPLRVNFGHELYPYTKEQLDLLTKYPQFNDLDPNWPKPKTIKRPNKYTVEYSDGTSETLDAVKMVAEGMNRFRNYRCAIGMEKIAIRYDGLVTAGSWCKANRTKHSIGNINDLENLQLPEHYVLCPHDVCVNVNDVKVSKWQTPKS